MKFISFKKVEDAYAFNTHIKFIVRMKYIHNTYGGNKIILLSLKFNRGPETC